MNDQSAAVADSGYIGTAGGQLLLSAAQGLANEGDLESESLSVVGLPNSTDGAVVRQPDGSGLFKAGVAGLSGFNYTVSESR